MEQCNSINSEPLRSFAFLLFPSLRFRPKGRRRNLERWLPTMPSNSMSRSGAEHHRGSSCLRDACSSARATKHTLSHSDLARSGRSATFHASLWWPQLQLAVPFASPRPKAEIDNKPRKKTSQAGRSQARFLPLSLSLARVPAHRPLEEAVLVVEWSVTTATRASGSVSVGFFSSASSASLSTPLR